MFLDRLDQGLGRVPVDEDPVGEVEVEVFVVVFVPDPGPLSLLDERRTGVVGRGPDEGARPVRDVLLRFLEQLSALLELRNQPGDRNRQGHDLGFRGGGLRRRLFHRFLGGLFGRFLRRLLPLLFAGFADGRRRRGGRGGRRRRGAFGVQSTQVGTAALAAIG